MMQIFISFIIFFLGIFHIGLPLYLDFIICTILALLFQSVIVSLITVFLLIISFILMNIVYIPQINYRAHEILQTTNRKYLPNMNIEMVQPFGDLYAIGSQNEHLDEIVEARDIIFTTDSLGYRNQKFQSEPNYLLIGDSFIVGNGTSQYEILSEQLEKILGEKIYNLGYPGYPQNYENTLKENEIFKTNKKNIILFYFEGNDFWLPIDLNKEVKTLSRIKSIIQKLETYKSNYLLSIYPNNFQFVRLINRKGQKSYADIYHLLTNYRNIPHKSKIMTEEIFGEKVGFLRLYNEISEAEVLETYIWDDADLIKSIKYVVFIPTKYRVYHDLDRNLPLEILRKGYEEFSVEVIDLTHVLRSAAMEQGKYGKFVYWRDDTHWNGIGIGAVANYLAGTLIVDH